VANGLRPDHYLLDIGCGCLRGGVKFVPFLEAGHYYGVDADEALLEAGRQEIRSIGAEDRNPNLNRIADFGFGKLGRKFDYALAQSVFTHLSFNSIARCLIEISRALEPGGKFFATYFENERGKPILDAVEWVGREVSIVSHFDQDPYHYAFQDLEYACSGLGLRVERGKDWRHPRKQRMAIFTRE